jgi:hypothetical protein
MSISKDPQQATHNTNLVLELIEENRILWESLTSWTMLQWEQTQSSWRHWWVSGQSLHIDTPLVCSRWSVPSPIHQVIFVHIRATHQSPI